MLGYQPDFERSDNFVGYTGDAVMRRDRSLSASVAFSSKRKFPAFEALVSADDFVCDLFYANLNEISNVIGNLHYFAISIAIVNDIRKLNAF